MSSTVEKHTKSTSSLCIILFEYKFAHLLMESPNQSQYNCKAGRDWREDGDPDVPVPP
jgi:hypothetical protein